MIAKRLALVVLETDVEASVALAAGFTAITVRKGGTWHRRSGMVFVYAMIATGVAAACIALYEGKATFTGAVFVPYLVFTALTSVRPIAGLGRRADIGLMVLAFTLAFAGFRLAFMALRSPGHQLDGVPAGMMFFMHGIMLLAGIGDARMIFAGGIRGPRRIARHLWRMSFALFIASGSFFLGQMKFIPRPVRSMPLLGLLAISPLVIMLYWMWRVRLRRNPRGVVTATTLQYKV
jgi:hypothetical protein